MQRAGREFLARASSLDESLFVRVADRLRAVVDAGLGEEVVDMALHGRLADVEASRDLAVGEALRDQREHFDLAWRQAVGEIGTAGDCVDEVVLYSGIDRRLAARNGCDRAFDLLCSCVFGEEAASSGAERLDNRAVVG